MLHSSTGRLQFLFAMHYLIYNQILSSYGRSLFSIFSLQFIDHGGEDWAERLCRAGQFSLCDLRAAVFKSPQILLSALYIKLFSVFAFRHYEAHWLWVYNFEFFKWETADRIVSSCFWIKPVQGPERLLIYSLGDYWEIGCWYTGACSVFAHARTYNTRLLSCEALCWPAVCVIGPCSRLKYDWCFCSKVGPVWRIICFSVQLSFSLPKFLTHSPSDCFN